MEDRTWTMNCVLLGAKLGLLLAREDSHVTRARILEELRNLTSELSDLDRSYLLGRLLEVCGL